MWSFVGGVLWRLGVGVGVEGRLRPVGDIEKWLVMADESGLGCATTRFVNVQILRGGCGRSTGCMKCRHLGCFRCPMR